MRNLAKIQMLPKHPPPWYYTECCGEPPPSDTISLGNTYYRGEQGELAPHVFLLTWLLPTYGDDVFMMHIYQSEYQELMVAKPVLV